MSSARIKTPPGTGRMRSVVTIIASSGHGGSITPANRLSVGYGLSKMFVMRPWSGYAIRDIEVDGISIGPVTLYMFTNLTEDHTIRATFERKRPGAPATRAG